MRSQMITITPELAAAMLSHNTRNRALMKSHVASLAQQMTNGTFRTTHQGIAFLSDGTLADGQHRLAAIVMSGKSIEMLVTTGLEVQDVEAVDWNTASRRLHDVFRMKGVGTDSMLTTPACNSAIMIIMRRFTKFGGGRKTQGDLKAISDFYGRHEQSINAVLKAFEKPIGDRKQWLNSHILAAYIAILASGHAEMADIARFHEILSTGEYECFTPGERAVISFRNFMLAQNAGRSKIWRDSPQKTAKKMMRAFEAFMDGENLKAVREVADFCYQLPE